MLTDAYTVLVNVDGFDLDDVAEQLRSSFQEFVRSETWPTNQVHFVENREEPDSSEPDDLPVWTLGLDLGLDHIDAVPDWFSSVESLIALLKRLHEQTGREFVLSMGFHFRDDLQEHLLFIDDKPVDSARLKAAIVRLKRTTRRSPTP